jgi:hypothetical protein
MPNYLPLPEKIKHHRELVGIVANAGVPAPARWTELSDRLDAFMAMDNTYADALAAAVVNPSKATDVPMLRALAAAEQTAGPQVLAAVNAPVIAAVEAAMSEAIAPVAADNYRLVAEQFNTAAAAFHAAAQAADPEAEARDMVTADDTARQAWLAAEVNAAKLTQLIPPLLAAAQLTGLRIDLADERINEAWWSAVIDPAAIFGLTVDAGELHRRRAWEAFDGDGGRTGDSEGNRTGRWGRLVALGARLRAPDLDSYAPYRRPAPLVHRQRQIAGRPIGYVENVVSDPEDHRPAVAAIEPARDTSLRKSRMTAV